MSHVTQVTRHTSHKSHTSHVTRHLGHCWNTNELNVHNCIRLLGYNWTPPPPPSSLFIDDDDDNLDCLSAASDEKPKANKTRTLYVFISSFPLLTRRAVDISHRHHHRTADANVGESWWFRPSGPACTMQCTQCINQTTLSNSEILLQIQ
jgi:hypothetical protein